MKAPNLGLLQFVVLIGSMISDEGSKPEDCCNVVLLIGSIISDEGSKSGTVAICGIDSVYHIR